MKTSRTLLSGAALAAAITTTLVAVPTVSAAPAALTAGHGHHTEPLRILLTNDDGYDAPGLVAVRDALAAAGHDVTVVAPAANQSGSGARATFGGTLTVTRPDARTYAVAGSPADAVEVGLSAVFADSPPDLVVSGSNAGQNVGAAAIHSGTVGAAVTALTDGVPAIAVSTELAPAGVATPYAATADYVVDLVGDLRRQAGRGRALMPRGAGLNVNYPVVDGPRAPRPQLSRIGNGGLDLDYTGALPSVGSSSPLAVVVDQAVPEQRRDADTTALARDRVSVSVIGSTYDADVSRGWVRGIVR